MTTGSSVGLEVAGFSVHWFLCSVWRLLVPLFSLEVAGSSVQSGGC